MIQIEDFLGRLIKFDTTPSRVISLVPSLTQAICDVGLEDTLVGITKFCVNPSHIKNNINIIGGTKNPRIEDILSLKPDLIIANKEENRKEDILVLEDHVNVYVSDINTTEDFLLFCDDFKKIFPLSRFDTLSQEIKNLNKQIPLSLHPIKVLYLIWKNPYMSVGKDTFIHHMMTTYGFQNTMSDETRYPELSIDDMKAKEIDFIFLSSEPYPFQEKDLIELKKYLPESHMILVDGEMFSWYGSALIKAHHYLIDLQKKCEEMQIIKQYN